MIHTNRCKHCGHDMGLHHYETNQCLLNGIEVIDGPQQWADTTFTDSGLAALDAHKEELYEAVVDFMGKNSWNDAKPYKKIQSILNQIEKEKWV